MVSEIYLATSAALAQERRLEILTNNLANINTIGYKEDQADFESLFLSSSEEGEISSSSWLANIYPNIYPVFKGIKTNFASGPFKETGNPLDLGIEGKGFFTIDTPQGLRYTRQGNFILDPEGRLVTQGGLPVMGENGTITLNGQKIEIDFQGEIWVDGKKIDTLKIVDFPLPYNLIKIGNALFALEEGKEATAEKAREFQLRQGFLELANVNLIKEMTAMIDLLRSYEACQKIIQSINATTTSAVEEVGRVA